MLKCVTATALSGIKTGDFLLHPAKSMPNKQRASKATNEFFFKNLFFMVIDLCLCE